MPTEPNHLYIWTLFIVATINFPIVIFLEIYIKNMNPKMIYALTPKLSQLRKEKLNSLITTPIHAVIISIFWRTEFLNIGEETWYLLTITFIITFIWTEIWHYASHIAMHTRILHWAHREHHKSMITNPWSSLSFSLSEKSIFSVGIVGGVSIISSLHPVSFIGVCIYYLIYFYTNALGHSNFEIRKEGYYDRFWGKIFNTPTFHAMHHARYTKNFGLITPWLDIAFHTAWDDFSEVQSSAASGKPLLHLKSKVVHNKQP